MFDGGVPEQFHQFIAAASRTPSSSPLPLPSLSLPLPLSFPLHLGGFDPFITHHNPNHPPPHHHQVHHHHLFPPPPQPTLPHHLFDHHKDDDNGREEDEHERRVTENHDINLDAADDSRVVPRSISDPPGDRPWTNDEVIALLRIRSSMETWFPPKITWEQVSRKLAEIGFKRSPEKCKEKFEEQSMRSIFGHTNNVATGNNNINFSKNNYRLLVGDEHEVDLYTPPQLNNNPPQFNVDNHDRVVDKPVEELPQEAAKEGDIEDSRTEEDNIIVKKRKVRNNKRFEMFKGFCLSVVEKLMAQQDEMQKKLLEDMLRRDKEMVEREEAWKKVELERINKELDLREKENAIVGSRQAAIVEFLKKFTDLDGNFLEMLSGSEGRTSLETQKHSSPSGDNLNKIEENVPSIAMVESIPPQPNTDNEVTPDHTTANDVQKSMPPRNPPVTNASKADGGSDTRKRWPREEVLALINLRCNINDDKDHQGAAKAPLWERISQGMSESGYTRSAKRCKEKWENINKYFRKTKDINANKKRSLESRTCPYFHQLSALYNQGKLVLSSENRPTSPESVKESDQAAASGSKHVGGE